MVKYDGSINRAIQERLVNKAIVDGDVKGNTFRNKYDFVSIAQKKLKKTMDYSYLNELVICITGKPIQKKLMSKAEIAKRLVKSNIAKDETEAKQYASFLINNGFAETGFDEFENVDGKKRYALREVGVPGYL